MATMQQVADYAGVSLKTVSNVVNGYLHVSPRTRAKVEEALATLGYRPNMAARNLARGRTGLIALIVPHIDNPYFSSLARGVIEVAGEHDLTVLIDQTGGTSTGELAALREVSGRFVDGTIFSPLVLGPEEIATVPGLPPMVLLGERTGATPIADHVGIDNLAAARDAVAHLLAVGCRRIALVGDQPGREGPSSSRTEGALVALDDAGMSLQAGMAPPVAEYTRADGYAAALALLDRPAPPDGIFCYNDVLAMGVLAAARESGVAVPDDLAVVGFDDLDESRYAAPPLTSVAPDRALIARESVTRLVAVLTGAQRPTTASAHQHVNVSHRLVVRESTRSGAGR